MSDQYLEKHTEEALQTELYTRKRKREAGGLSVYTDEQLQEELMRKRHKRKEAALKPLDKPDFKAIVKSCKNYVEYFLSDNYHEDNDLEHYMFEDMMEAVYGEDIFDRLYEVRKV